MNTSAHSQRGLWVRLCVPCFLGEEGGRGARGGVRDSEGRADCRSPVTVVVPWTETGPFAKRELQASRPETWAAILRRLFP